MRIVIVTEALVTGGAETFVLRLAASLQALGHKVVIFVLRGDLVYLKQMNLLASGVPFEPVRIPFLSLVLKLDGLFYRLGVGFSLLRWYQILRLTKYLLAEEVDVVHSHLLSADLVTSKSCKTLGIPWVSTMHGDYLALEHKGNSRSSRIPNFLEACSEVEKTVSQIVCITDSQFQQLLRLMPTLTDQGRISKVYNGYATRKHNKDERPEIYQRIPTEAFVIGMVSRGVKDKGWDVLVGAFEALNWPDAWLVLVGDGDHLQKLKSTHLHPRIVFCGNVVDPLSYIIRFDVACLPSQFATESLPTVVIEYVLMGKPVIATNVGEIPQMLDAERESPAGLLIELAETSEMVLQMQAALKAIYFDESLREAMGVNALHASKKFDMDACVHAYLDIYEKAQR